jgi:hypothetical protein
MLVSLIGSNSHEPLNIIILDSSYSSFLVLPLVVAFSALCSRTTTILYSQVKFMVQRAIRQSIRAAKKVTVNQQHIDHKKRGLDNIFFQPEASIKLLVPSHPILKSPKLRPKHKGNFASQTPVKHRLGPKFPTQHQTPHAETRRRGAVGRRVLTRRRR